MADNTVNDGMTDKERDNWHERMQRLALRALPARYRNLPMRTWEPAPILENDFSRNAITALSPAPISPEDVPTKGPVNNDGAAAWAGWGVGTAGSLLTGAAEAKLGMAILGLGAKKAEKITLEHQAMRKYIAEDAEKNAANAQLRKKGKDVLEKLKLEGTSISAADEEKYIEAYMAMAQKAALNEAESKKTPIRSTLKYLWKHRPSFAALTVLGGLGIAGVASLVQNAPNLTQEQIEEKIKEQRQARAKEIEAAQNPVTRLKVLEGLKKKYPGFVPGKSMEDMANDKELSQKFVEVVAKNKHQDVIQVYLKKFNLQGVSAVVSSTADKDGSPIHIFDLSKLRAQEGDKNLIIKYKGETLKAASAEGIYVVKDPTASAATFTVHRPGKDIMDSVTGKKTGKKTLDPQIGQVDLPIDRIELQKVQLDAAGTKPKAASKQDVKSGPSLG